MTDLIECKLVIPGCLYIHLFPEEMHRAVIQNLCIVSSRIEENKTRGLVRSHCVAKVLGQLTLSQVQALKQDTTSSPGNKKEKSLGGDSYLNQPKKSNNRIKFWF